MHNGCSDSKKRELWELRGAKGTRKWVNGLNFNSDDIEQSTHGMVRASRAVLFMVDDVPVVFSRVFWPSLATTVVDCSERSDITQSTDPDPR